MPVTFTDLWDAYPSERAPCSNQAGQSNFDNQCAIRMSLCLVQADIDLASCRAVRCWHGHGRRHVLRAQELADWLASRNGRLQFGRVARRKDVSHTHYAGQSGIVFFRNFYGTGNQGDHIDLWDGEVVRTGAMDYFARSQEVWSWHVG